LVRVRVRDFIIMVVHLRLYIKFVKKMKIYPAGGFHPPGLLNNHIVMMTKKRNTFATHDYSISRGTKARIPGFLLIFEKAIS
jgi:hypothetical protein